MQFSLIEKYLVSLAPDFDQKQRFLSLLKYLQSDNIISVDLIILLRDIFHTRNIVVSSPSDVSLSPDVVEQMQKILQGLNL